MTTNNVNRPATAQSIAKADIAAWLATLMRDAEVIAPTLAPGGDVMFAAIGSPAEVAWDYENTLHPPKQFVLPQTEPLLAIKKNGQGYEIEPIHDERRRILFGVRSCDAKAIEFLGRVHAFDLPDTAYLRRVANLTVVSLSCPVPCRQGFCVCCDAGPFLDAGYDVQLTDLGERILAEPGSESGAALLQRAGVPFRGASAEELRQRVELEERAKQSFGEETCHLGAAMRRVSTGRVAESLWAAMAEECFECGGCNFACPTCYCFSVKDQRQDCGFVRCRTWDSCQYAAFTLEASGHNPRALHKDRVKRRFFHKVSAQYYQRDGAPGCVGCGRCITVCLGTPDMPAVVAAIRKGAWNG